MTLRPLFASNFDKVDWDHLSMNPNAIHLLEQNPDKIEWDYLSLNPNAIHLLEANPEKIRWYGLSKNPSAGHLLQSNKLDWSALSENTCPEAIQLLEMYPNCINWTKLSRNPAAIHICKKYPTKFIPPKPGKVVFDTIKWEWVVPTINYKQLAREYDMFDIKVKTGPFSVNDVMEHIHNMYDDTLSSFVRIFKHSPQTIRRLQNPQGGQRRTQSR